MKLRDFFYPRTCLFCEGEVRENGLCYDCLENLGFAPRQVEGNYPHLEAIYFPLLFSTFTQKQIHAFKFQEKRYLSKLFGSFMAETAFFYNLHREIDQISFIPMTRQKKNRRGYNQSELLAQGISEIMRIPMAGSLMQVRETKDQIGLSERERVENLIDSFSAHSHVSGKKILLIDDVFTTGSTLSEGARALRACGADVVFGLVITQAGFTL